MSVEISDHNARWAGWLLSDLVLRPKDWVHRRVETLVFDDAVRGHRRVMIEFSVPEPRLEVPELSPQRTATLQLPIAFMRKRRTRVFHMVDENGTRCPVLTRPVRSRIAQDALASVANGLLGGEMDPAVQKELQTIAGDTIPRARRALDLFVTSSRPSKAHPVLERERVQQRRELFENESFRLLAYVLTWNTVLLTEVPNEPGHRCVREFSYEERALIKPLRDRIAGEFRGEEQDSTLRQRARWRTARALDAFGRGLGWTPRSLWLPCPAVAYADSYHFEVEAPSGTQITSSSLFLTSSWSPRRDPYHRTMEEMPKFHRAAKPADYERGCLSRSHLYMRDTTTGNASGFAEVHLRARRDTFVQAGALSSLLAVVMLAAGMRFRCRLAVDAGTTLLLLLPSALTAFVVQPGEHPMAARILRGVRAFALLGGLATVVAAGALVVGDGGPPSKSAWTVTIVMAGVSTAVLAGAWVQARPRRYRSSGQDLERRHRVELV